MAIENLWGTSQTSVGVTITNPNNAIDSLFNNVNATFEPKATGNFTWSVISDTVVTADADLNYVALEVAFYCPSLAGQVTNLEIYDGSSWTVLATYSISNPMPLTLTTLSFNVSSILNTVAKINACQVRFNNTTKKTGDLTYLDEARLVVTSVNKINVNDLVTITEDLVISKPPGAFSISDNVSIAEIVSLLPTVLYINTYEPFGILISESVYPLIDTLDVGVVMDAINVLEYAEAFIPQLFIVASRTIIITEFVEFYSEFSLTAEDSASVSEDIEVVVDPLRILQSEDISAVSLGICAIPVLDINVLDPFHVLISEFAFVIDAIVDIGVSMDAITVNGNIASVYIDRLNITISDDEQPITVNDFAGATVSIDISVSDSITAQDSASEEIVTGIFALDNISISESAIIYFGVTTDVWDSIVMVEDIALKVEISLYIDNETVSVQEDISAYAYNLVVNLSIYEYINITEDLNITPAGASVQVSDQIFALEDVIVALDVLNALATDQILILEQVAELLSEIFIEVSDLIACVENLQTSYGEGNISVSDDITVNEALLIMTTGLYDENVLALDQIAVNETIYLALDLLFLDRSDIISVSDIITMGLGDLGLIVQENITVSEVLGVRIDKLFLSVIDQIPVSEAYSSVLSILNLLAVDPYGVLVTESISILDIGVEVGVVREQIHVDEFTYLYLDILRPFAPDLPEGLVGQHRVDEFIEMYLEISAQVASTATISEQVNTYIGVNFNISDVIGVLETVSIVRDPQFAVVDSIIITEVVTISFEGAPVTMSIFDFEQILASEAISARLDLLNLAVADTITIAEYFNLLDIIIELGPVFDTVAIAEVRTVSVSYQAQLFINVFDTVNFLGQFVTFGFDPLALAVSDSVVLAESVILFDIIIELEAGEPVTVTEFINVPAPFEYVDIDLNIGEDITLVESGSFVLDRLNANISDDIAIFEDISLLQTGLNISVVDLVAVVDVYLPDELRIVSVYDAVVISERAFIMAEGFITRPPIIFNFAPGQRMLFDYEKRTLQFSSERGI